MVPALLVTGELLLSRDGVVPGRAAMIVFTGHRIHRCVPLSDVMISSESRMMYIVRIWTNEWTPC